MGVSLTLRQELAVAKEVVISGATVTVELAAAVPHSIRAAAAQPAQPEISKSALI